VCPNSHVSAEGKKKAKKETKIRKTIKVKRKIK
jgi:hypothetical protein